MINIFSLKLSKETFDRFGQKDLDDFGAAHFDYTKRRLFLLEKFFPLYAKSSFLELLVHMYVQLGKSCVEISEDFASVADIAYSPRSVERALRRAGVTLRPIKEAFNLAIKKGRVEWAWRKRKNIPSPNRAQIPPKLRLFVLQRDKFRCRLCGAGAASSVLEIDHITPRSEGGSNDKTNLRVLCHECNVGKRVLNQEGGQPVGTFVSRHVARS